MKKLSSDYTRINVIHPDIIKTPVYFDPSLLSRDYTRVAAQAGEQPPDLGQVSELIRNTLTKEYGIYPPNLSTAIQQDNTIVITAVNPQTGLNLQVTLKNLAADLITPGGVTPGVVPIEGQQGQGGAPPAPGGAPPGGMGPGMAPPPGGSGGAPPGM